MTEQALHSPQRVSSHRLSLRAIAGMLFATILALVGFSTPASAQDMAKEYAVTGSVDADGTLTVNEKITFEGAAPKLVQRLENSRPALDYSNYEFTYSNIKATAGGQDLGAEVSTDGNYTVVTVDGAKAGNNPVEISYDVDGAAFRGGDAAGVEPLTEIRWRVLQGLNVAVEEVTGQIQTGPAMVRDIDCQAGPPTALVSCQTFSTSTFETRYPEFTNGKLGAGGVVEIAFKVESSAVPPNQVIKEQWTLDRAFSVAPAPLWSAIAALVLGGLGLWAFARRRGGDASASADPTRIASFDPVAEGVSRFTVHENVLPGEVGTIVDERVDPVDVAATVVDLAQRGHLKIVELPRESAHAPLNWEIERTASKDALADYETELLNSFVPNAGDAVKLSDASDKVTNAVPEVQSKIYDEVVKDGWFSHRPDEVRDGWLKVGITAVILAFVALALLVAFTRFGLLGLALVALAVGMLFVAQEMPRRTAAGASTLKGLDLLATELRTQPVDQVPANSAYDEISRILPYAIVLGSQQRWLDAFAAADNDPGVPDPDDISWYHAPATWQLSDLPASMDAFITTLEGRLYSRG